MFFLQYIKCIPEEYQDGNFFSDWGLHVHSILEKYYKKELEVYELSSTYVDGYKEAVIHSAPPNKFVNLSESYFKKGKVYFDNFEDLYENHNILGVEEQIEVEVDGRKFTGYIDLNTEYRNEIYIIDNKSKKEFKNKKEHDEYLRQLYLYSIHTYNKYNEFPRWLDFNLVRGDGLLRVEFNKNEFEKSKQWLIREIDKIYKDTEFKPRPNQFFCDWLCNVHYFCEYSSKFIQKWSDV